MPDLTGQCAIISGGLGDIGRAIALACAESGADVAMGDVLESGEATELVAAVRKTGRLARYDQVDVSDFATVKSWVAKVETELGTPSIVIPNAAVVQPGGFTGTTAERWQREIAINLNGAFHLAKAGVDRMLAEGIGGRVVFVGSWAAHAPHPHIPAYAASKAGLRMLMKCMAVELAGRGILVNEVAPGYVNAGLSGRHFQEDPVAAKKARGRVPVRQFIEPDEVARQVLHLCDPANRHTTGSTLLMDGGLSLTSAADQLR